jgi:hypothetical protein
VLDLLNHLHEFNVEDAMKISMDQIASTGSDAHDQFELDEIETSRLVVESLLSPTMSENIQTCFDHDDSFFNYPGNILLVIFLGVCTLYCIFK